jgi:hypothetical protein
MADTRRGKKQNHDKNFTAAKDFKAGKKIGRKKQVWVPDGVIINMNNGEPVSVAGMTGHWEKI